MALSEIEREILDLADEDYYGLWEIGWRLATALLVDPSLAPGPAAEAIASLRRRGLVDIYVRQWIDDTPQPISLLGLTIDLNEPSAWREPRPGQPQFLIGGVDDEGAVGRV